jgi:hypothetical protein
MPSCGDFTSTRFPHVSGTAGPTPRARAVGATGPGALRPCSGRLAGSPPAQPVVSLLMVTENRTGGKSPPGALRGAFSDCQVGEEDVAQDEENKGVWIGCPALCSGARSSRLGERCDSVAFRKPRFPRKQKSLSGNSMSLEKLPEKRGIPRPGTLAVLVLKNSWRPKPSSGACPDSSGFPMERGGMGPADGGDQSWLWANAFLQMPRD